MASEDPCAQQGSDPDSSLSFGGEEPCLQPLCEPLPISGRLVKTLEIFVNERYSPLLGYSVDGLLMNDRGPYSNHDGTISFSTLDEAERGLSSPGWQFRGSWMLSSVQNNSVIPLALTGNDEGWMYSKDFSSYTYPYSGHAKKTMSHFVRRRKLEIIQAFNEHAICAAGEEDYACQSCDYRRVELLAPLLLDALWRGLFVRYATRHHHKDQQQQHQQMLRQDRIVKLKTRMIEALFRPKVTGTVGTQQHDGSSGYSHSTAAQRLEAFVQSQAVHKAHNIPVFNAQRPECTTLLASFTLEEREGIVRALIRKSDRTFTYHCQDPHCGSDCPFAVHRCPNPNCNVRFSRKWWGEHDANCPHKVITCPLLCGRLCVRRLSERHVQEECIMRPVPCPYQHIGCYPEGLIYRDVATHLALNPAYHLSLTSTAINKASEEVGALRTQIEERKRHIQQLGATPVQELPFRP